MQAFSPLRSLRPESGYSRGDVLVVFGEVFARGYVNGLIDEAKAAGMTVLYATVGRRSPTGDLRPLHQDELSQKDQPLINIPLECGFDLEPCAEGVSTPCDQLKGLKLSEWNQARLDWDQVSASRVRGRKSFRDRVARYVAELQNQIPPNAKILVAHTMAGGVPRAKILMPAMNRVFKGYGERYASSQEFWEGELGRLCAASFLDVTAHSLRDLIEVSEPLRANNRQVAYVAYGYHGTEILHGDDFKWQSYAPYLQGFAKLELENIAREFHAGGISVSVYNAPEILTNSSSIFLGVEVALYPLLGAFKKLRPNDKVTNDLISACAGLLKPESSLDELLELTDRYFGSEIIEKRWTDYPRWPQHNGPEQMELMRTTSEKILAMHRDEKHLMTATLSELVFTKTGRAMLREALNPSQPVWWIGHDLVVTA